MHEDTYPAGTLVVFTGGVRPESTGVYRMGGATPGGGQIAWKVSRFVRLFRRGPVGATISLALGRAEDALRWARRQIAEALED